MASSGDLVPVLAITTTNPVADDVIRGNVAAAVARGLPTLAGYDKKGRDGLFTIVGSGPSVFDYLEQIKTRPLVVAAGSAHKLLLNNDIIPRAAVAIDPLPVMADFYQPSHEGVHYLIASQCDPAVFDALNGRRVTVWHAAVGVDIKDLLRPNWSMYGGGNTVLLRALAIGLAFGYRNFELFGFDCCLTDGRRHALREWDSLEAQGEDGTIPAVVNGRSFVTTIGLLSMAQSYREMSEKWGREIDYRIAIHGDGIPAWMTHGKQENAI